MDFANEEYRRLYVRDTITWKRLGWEGQCVLVQILRKMDRAGVLDLGGLPPADAVALAVGTEISNIETGLGRILHLEVLKHAGDTLVWPKFVEAQTVSKTDKQRQRESRDRRRSTSLDEPVAVTKRDDSESQNVTDCHGSSQSVTRGHSQSQAVTLSLAEHSEAEQSERKPRDARADAGDSKRGIDWYAAAVLSGDSTQLPDVSAWRNEYAVIGRKSAADRDAVARHITSDTWVQANRRAVDPAHFVKHWQRYAAGGRKTVGPDPSGAEAKEAGQKAAAASKVVQLRREYAEHIKRAKESGDLYTAEVLAAERDQRLARLQAQAS